MAAANGYRLSAGAHPRDHKRHEQFIATLENQAANIENADPLEAITKLLDQSRALKASYEAISRIRQLSLTDYL